MFKNQILKTATATMLVIVMIVGMVASLGKTARADENQGYGTTCTVTYSISDPKLVSSGSLTQEFAAGQPFAIVTPVLKARPGYYLIGYSRTGDASSTVYKRGDTAMFVGNVTLYPVWKKICVLTIDLRNEATVSSGSLEQTFTQSTPFAIDTPVVVSTRPGYYLLGYSTSGDNSTTVYKRGDVAVFADDVTLYPVWKKECKITYCLDAYSELSSGELEQTFTENAQVEIKTPVLKARPGYYLMGFSATGDASTTVYKRGDVARFSTDINLYPVWKAANAPTPTPTTAPNPTSAPTNNPTTAPTQPATPTPTVQGMPAPILTTTVTPAAEQTYTIIYHWLEGYDSGRDLMETQRAVVGQKVTLKDPENKILADGSILLGWSLYGSTKANRSIVCDYLLGETIDSLSSTAGNMVNLYPVLNFSYDISYSPYGIDGATYTQVFKDTYEHRNIPADQRIVIAPGLSQHVDEKVLPNHECIGFATRLVDGRYTTDGKFIEQGIVTSSTTALAGVDWVAREALAEKLRKADQEKLNRGETINDTDYCYDENGYLMCKRNGVWQPNHVGIILYPVWKEKGLDAIVSENGGIFEEDWGSQSALVGPFATRSKYVDLFLTKDQMKNLYENFYKYWLLHEGMPQDKSVLDEINDFLSGVGIVQTIIDLLDISNPPVWIAALTSPEVGVVLTVASILLCLCDDDDGFQEDLLGKLGKLTPGFEYGNVESVHIVLEIVRLELSEELVDENSEEISEVLVLDEFINVTSVELYDNMLLEHEHWWASGCWATGNVENVLMSYSN